MSRGPLVLLGLAVLLVVSISGGIAVAQEEPQYVRGEPSLEVYAPDPTLQPGSSNQVTLQVANDGTVRRGAVTQREIVTTARAVELEVENGPVEVETRQQTLGAVTDSEVREVPIVVTVPEDVDPGEYTLDVTMRYSHTYQFSPASNVVQERTRTVRESVDVVVTDSPRFALETAESDVQVGDSGTAVVDVENVGSQPARDVVVALESTSPDVTFGGSARTTARIDHLDSGASATVDVRTDVRDGVDVRTAAVDGSVRYTDPDGVEGLQEGLSVGISPATEQSFSLSVDHSSLRVGEPGTIEGTVHNDGPAAVDGLVLALGEAHLEPRSETYAVGSLEAGESNSFEFRGTVPPDADPVDQRLDVTMRYQSAASSDRSTTEPIQVAVADRRDAVAIDAVDPAFAAGEDGTLTLEVTNQRDVEIRDVRLSLVAAEPLESEFTTTLLPSLEPGETGTVAFDLEVDDDAPESSYPADLEITYLDPDDRTATPRTQTIAVTVTDAEGTVPVTEVLVGLLVVLVLGGGGWWFYGGSFG